MLLRAFALRNGLRQQGWRFAPVCYVRAKALTRRRTEKLIAALQMLEGKRDSNPAKKHGNIPL